MDTRNIIVCSGLQRSGNHAILDWVASLFPRTGFHNNQPHDLFADEAALRAAVTGSDEPCLIFSFEDSSRRAADPSLPLLDSVTPFPAAAFPGIRLHELGILRDPYNNWASRVAAHDRAKEGGHGLSSDPTWEMFRTNWLAIAARQKTDPDSVMLFNRWKNEPAYRRALCARLGGSYSEQTLNRIPTQGLGSSFDGMPRPSYGQMLRKLPKYTSGTFLTRLASKPGHYMRRFLTPPATGGQLKVEDRWKFLLDRPEGQAMFADDEIRAEALRIFGAAFDREGRKITAAAAA